MGPGGYKCTGYPIYKTPTGAAADEAGATPLGAVPYACVRNNFAYTWPVTKDPSAYTPITSGTSVVRSFYQTSTQ